MALVASAVLSSTAVSLFTLKNPTILGFEVDTPLIVKTGISLLLLHLWQEKN